MATHFKVKTVVTNDVLFHEPSRRQLRDVVTCIRTRTTIDHVGFERERCTTLPWSDVQWQQHQYQHSVAIKTLC